MITREQVADLQPGDVVELRDERWPDVVTRGPLEQDMGEWLSLGGVVVASRKEGIAGLNRRHTLTVVSRAPRPLYVNHPRTEPVPGDVVRIEFDDGAEDDVCVNTYLPIASRPHDPWLSIYNTDAGTRYPTDMVIPGRDNNARGRAILLVDGETGRCVP